MDEFDGIEWDETKRQSNIAKHHLDFADAPHVLGRPYLCVAARTVNLEARWMAIGMLDDIAVAIVCTRRGSMLRLISMRKARHDEQQHYDETFGN